MIRRHVHAYVLIGLCAVLFAGCDQNSNPNDPSQANIEFTVTDLVVGTGSTAEVGTTANVNYTGWLFNAGRPESKGVQFDAGTTQVAIGRQLTIPGFEQGLIGMRVGGRRRIYVPSGLAFGPSGSSDGRIPPNAALVFEVELVSLQ